MKTAIIIFPGSNCDNEMERFLHKCTGIAPIRVWHKETTLPKVDLYVLPGGFSYGDYLRAGALANLSPIVKELKKTDRKILGICNGFQVLCEAGLLPGTLRINKTEKFICKPVDITTWPVHYKRRIPIAHAEGNYYHPNSSKLVEEQKVAYTYSSYKDDINGSVRGICGVRNNNVLGMMPHPERAFESYHCSQDGFKIMDDLNA
jgi:phosphoribosylformylglycinamidine synthase